MATLSRRNSVKDGAGSRRGSAAAESDFGPFGLQKSLKKSKPVSSVKITFLGKNMVNMFPLLFYQYWVIYNVLAL